MIWTKEWPTLPGHYWRRCRQKGMEWDSPVVERIHRSSDTDEYKVSFWKKYEFEWCRIPEPVERGGTE